MPAPIIKEITRANTRDYATIVFQIGNQRLVVVSTINAADNTPLMEWSKVGDSSNKIDTIKESGQIGNREPPPSC